MSFPGAALAPFVSLQFSLADSPRTLIVEWFDDLSAKARGLCAQWHNTGAITLIATDDVWNAIPGNITNAAQVLAGTHAPAYRARPDFDPPADLDPAATAVELAKWRLEMDMHFAYTLAQNALALALLDSVGPANKASLKATFHPTPLHFLTPRQIVDSMFIKHASLTGPDLKALRAPLLEPLLAIADLDQHMIAFMLASMKLSATGHGEDPYRYFEWFLATIKGFPLISTTMVGFYAMHPLVAQQTITNLFAFLTPQVTHLIDQTGSAPFSGGASTASTGLTRRTKKNKGNRTKGTWGNWPTSATPGDFAGASIQAQTPHPSLAAQREAAYVAEIQQLRALVATSDTATAFFVQQQQQHAYALQNAPSAFRPRSHYCGFHGWNNDHNGTACRAMAGDKRFTDAMNV